MPLLLLLQMWKPKTGSESYPGQEKAENAVQKHLCLLDKQENEQPVSCLQTKEPTNHKMEVSPTPVSKALGCSDGMFGTETALVLSTVMQGLMEVCLEVPQEPPIVQAEAPSAPPHWPCAPPPCPAPLCFCAHAAAPP